MQNNSAASLDVLTRNTDSVTLSLHLNSKTL